jgi:hypothetical protein
VYSCSEKKESGQVSTCRIGPFPCQSTFSSIKYNIHFNIILAKRIGVEATLDCDFDRVESRQQEYYVWISVGFFSFS